MGPTDETEYIPREVLPSVDDRGSGVADVGIRDVAVRESAPAGVAVWNVARHGAAVATEQAWRGGRYVSRELAEGLARTPGEAARYARYARTAGRYGAWAGGLAYQAGRAATAVGARVVDASWSKSGGGPGGVDGAVGRAGSAVQTKLAHLENGEGLLRGAAARWGRLAKYRLPIEG